MIKSKNSMLDLVKKLSAVSVNEELTCTIKEYDDLILELYGIDKFLQEKYDHVSKVPRLYSLYGVKITIS